MANILLTGGRAPAALELARIFHSAGHRVFLAESQAGNLSEPSNTIRGHFLVPPPRQQYAGFIQALRGIIAKKQIDLLVPTCEEVFYISMGLKQLAPLCRVFVDPLDRLQSLHHKYSFTQVCREFGLPVPESRQIKNLEDLQNVFQSWPRLVLKPVYSRFATQTLILPTPGKRLWDFFQESKTIWVAQEYIEGLAYCSYSTAHQGHLTAHAVYRSDFTAGQGATLVFKSIHHPGILKWVETFTSLYQFSGQIAFDFIERPDGRLYAIECNPRATSGIHLFAGQPMAAQAFFDAHLETLFPPPNGPSYMLSAAMLVYALPGAVKTHRLANWMGAFLASRDVIFRWDDPLPALLQLRALSHFVQMGERMGLTALQASTADIEWNGE